MDTGHPLTEPQMQSLAGLAHSRERDLWMSFLLCDSPLLLPHMSVLPGPGLFQDSPHCFLVVLSPLPTWEMALFRVSFATSEPWGVTPPCVSLFCSSGLVKAKHFYARASFSTVQATESCWLQKHSCLFCLFASWPDCVEHHIKLGTKPDSFIPRIHLGVPPCFLPSLSPPSFPPLPLSSFLQLLASLLVCTCPSSP